MGMFDEIVVKVELPKVRELEELGIKIKQNTIWQTKDLDNTMSRYIIAKNGYLYLEIVNGRWVEPTEDQKKKNRWNFGEFIVESKTKKREKFHGTINFYSTVNISEEEDAWVEFNAHFIYGKLDKIEFFKFDKTKSGLMTSKEISEILKKEKLKISYKIKSFLNIFGWSKFWRFVSKVLYKIQNFLSSVNIFIHRYLT